MKQLLQWFCLLMLAALLTSCGALEGTPTESPQAMGPGGRIEGMTLEDGELLLPHRQLWDYCEYMSDSLQPAVSTAECDVPQFSALTIQFGWFAKASHLDPNWEDMTWELSIDGNQVDLESFKLQETSSTAHGEDNRSRFWVINLLDPVPGRHTLRLVQVFKAAVDDGFDLYAAGTHQHSVEFTILPGADYPGITADAVAGQHAFSSKKAALDFLLYLPDGYGTDPNAEWPLVLYLHGAPVRGTTLELLRQEPFPRELDRKSQPFIAVSPLGDGGFEFWAADEMMDSVFILLDEIRELYSVDPKRMYLTGNDMGGNGVWAMGMRHPDYFAALAPIAGYGAYPFTVPQSICDLKDVPVLAYHGARDDIVPVAVEQEMVDALNACGGTAQLTVSDDMKNDVPLKVYAGPELYSWLLAQARP